MIYEKLIEKVRYPNEYEVELDERVPYYDKIEYLKLEILWAENDGKKAKFERTLKELERRWAERKIQISIRVIIKEFDNIEGIGVISYCNFDETQENKKLSGKPRLLTLKNGKEFKILDAKVSAPVTANSSITLSIDAEDIPMFLYEPQAGLVSFWTNPKSQEMYAFL